MVDGWKMGTGAACGGNSCMDGVAEDPGAVNATRLPVKSTPSCGQRPVR